MHSKLHLHLFCFKVFSQEIDWRSLCNASILAEISAHDLSRFHTLAIYLSYHSNNLMVTKGGIENNG